VTALQAQTSKPAADRVTATAETARDLRGALSRSPEFFKQRYVLRIKTHGRHYNADCQLQASLSLVFVRLADDRRLVGMVLFFLLVLFVFIRISGRYPAVHYHEGTLVDEPGERFLGDVLLHVATPPVWTLVGFYLSCSGFPMRSNRSFAGNASGGPPAAAYVQPNAADVDVIGKIQVDHQLQMSSTGVSFGRRRVGWLHAQERINRFYVFLRARISLQANQGA
jgi:hypothetical protein